MIAHIIGKVGDKRVSSIVIDVNGIGYEVNMTQRDLDQTRSAESIMVHTYFAVRENSQELYGFLSGDSKNLFELLLGVSGVGPKVAMSITSLGEAKEVKSAIASSNVAYIQSANGVGKRGAEKVIVELKDKVGAIVDESFVLNDLSASDDAASALLALGFTQQQASQALALVDGSLSVEERVKSALVELNKS